MKTDKIITSKMAAEILGFTPAYIRRLIMEGKINATKLGHDWIFTKKDIAHITPKRIKEAD